MKVFHKVLANRLNLLVVILLLGGLALSSRSHQTQAAPLDAPPNVPVVTLYLGSCYANLANATELDFYYYKLDGTIGGRSATFDNGGLTYNNGVATAQFYQVSFNYLQSTALYEFISSAGSPVDVYVDPVAWGRNPNNGNIFATLGC